MVCHTLAGIQHCLKEIGANKLVTVEEWARLYLFLCHKHKLDLTCKPMLPRSFTDLVYKTKLLFQSLHKLRFAMLEGQKRTYSTVLCLLGFIPHSSLTPHYRMRDSIKYDVTMITYFDRNKIMHKAEAEANKILAKFDIAVLPSYTEVLRDEEGLSAKVIAVYREYSRRLAHQNVDAQHRGWRTVLVNILEDKAVIKASKPFELYDNTKRKPENSSISAWVKGYRKAFLLKLLSDKNLPDIKQSFTTTTKQMFARSSHDAIAEAMVDTKNVRYLSEFGLNVGQPPVSDRLVYVIMTMITCTVTDDTEAQMMFKVLNSGGRMPSNRRYSKDFVFEMSDYPQTFDLEVSFLSWCAQNYLLDRSAI
jgi:hypothetical protein